MDGYAVRAVDTRGAPVRLRVLGTLPAGGDPDQFKVEPGTSVRIMTGAAIPSGANAIAKVEITHSEDSDCVTIEESVPEGEHVRPSGEDVGAGQLVFPAGTLLGPGHVGVLAAIGRNQVLVTPRPCVGVFSTGDELVEAGIALRPGQVRDANRHALLGLLRQAGFASLDLGLVRDDIAMIEETLRDGVARCDAIVSSGGVSMGDFDFVKLVLDRLGDMHAMQVAIKPAKPLAFGVIGDVPSSMVSFELFARPGLRQMAGFADDELSHPMVMALAAEPLRRRSDGRTHFMRVTAVRRQDGRYLVRSAGGQQSNQLRAMALADALAIVPDGEGIDAGSAVEIMLLG
jgi:molybdenum cofactor synthesis domain-containing protein